jgi:hypothetical protein
LFENIFQSTFFCEHWFNRSVSLFITDNKYGPCEERLKVQFNNRFIEWLAITHAEEQAEGFSDFDVVAFTENVRLYGLSDSKMSEIQNVCVFLS